MRRIATICLGLSIVGSAIAILVLILSSSSETGQQQAPAFTSSSATAGTNSPTLLAPSYDESELLIDPIINESVAAMHPWVKYRTSDESLAAVDTKLAEIRSLQGYERDRTLFEYLVDAQLTLLRSSLEGDLHFAEGTLAQAFNTALENCARDAGLADGLAAFVALDVEDENLSKPAGYSDSELLDLRHSCAIAAARYPTLSAQEREQLISRTTSQLRYLIDQWLLDNPDIVVRAR